jgi:two-component system, OmpR family, phosphate regulon sensor histidine kinase PhoR
MRNFSPRQLALFLSLIISLVCAILLVVSLYLSFISSVLLVIGTLLLSFIISFLIIYYAVNYFILKKVNPLYETIKNIPITTEELREKLEGKDIIQEVNSLVIDYTRIRAKEIKNLRRLEKYRKEFLGNVSHELKTPIFNIQGYILTLLDGGLEDPEINREYLERTEKSISRMINILHDLESISKLESGKLKLAKKKFDIVQLVYEVFQLQDTIRSKYDIRLEFDIPNDKPKMVHADRQRIFEVLNNLIVNSIVYGKKGGRTRVMIEETGDSILVSISDDGIGINEEEIPRIFERFYRTDRSRSRDSGGTGLGLAIVKHIIEAHNQNITVSSESDKGSVFSFTLKRA